jgi:hypothetical protein
LLPWVLTGKVGGSTIELVGVVASGVEADNWHPANPIPNKITTNIKAETFL